MESVYTGRKFDEFELNETFESPGRTITDAHIVAFSGLSGDFNPLHTDDEFCKNTRQGRRIVHGALTFTIAAGMFNRYVDGSCIAFLEVNTRYLQMVFPGDTIHIRVTIIDKRLSKDGEKGVITFGIESINQAGEVVLDGKWVLLIKR